MFIYWEYKNVVTKINDRYFFCPQCNVNRLGFVKRIRKYFALYSIPIIPLGLRCQYVECPICEYEDIERVFEKSGSVNSFFRRTREFFSVGFFIVVFFSMIIAIKEHVFPEKRTKAKASKAVSFSSYTRKNLRTVTIANNTPWHQSIDVELKEGNSCHAIDAVLLDEFNTGVLTINGSGILRLTANQQDIIFDIVDKNLEYFVEINDKNKFKVYTKPNKVIQA